MTRLSKHLIAGAALAVLTTGTAQAQYPIFTGGERGSYFGTFGPLLLEILDREFFDYQLRTSAGSGENIDQVLNNPLAIGMTQTDVLAYETQNNPAITDNIVIIRNDKRLFAKYRENFEKHMEHSK